MDEKVRGICRSYSVITRCEFLEEDTFSVKLVEYYKRSVSCLTDDDESKNKLKRFDSIMRKYIEDYRFSKKLQKSIDTSKMINNDFDNYDVLIDYMFRFLEKYENDKKEVLTNTRWI